MKKKPKNKIGMFNSLRELVTQIDYRLNEEGTHIILTRKEYSRLNEMIPDTSGKKQKLVSFHGYRIKVK